MGKQEKPKKEKKHKKKQKRKKKSSKLDKRHKKTKSTDMTEETLESNYDIPLELMCKSHAPETPEEYQLRQKKIRHETDPITGRKRLIKGDGEILEEIVSRKQHLEINKLATQGDGRFFQDHLGNSQ